VTATDAVGAVAWPAVIEHAGKPELIFVRDADEWRLDPDLRRRRFSAGHRLIDSRGHVFGFGVAAGGPPVLTPSVETVAPATLETLVRRHLQARRIPGELLDGYLSEYAPSQRTRALILYIGKHDRRDEHDDHDEPAAD
jgi:hypothetical protein